MKMPLVPTSDVKIREINPQYKSKRSSSWELLLLISTNQFNLIINF